MKNNPSERTFELQGQKQPCQVLPRTDGKTCFQVW